MKAVMLDVPGHILEERRKKGGDRFDEVWEGVLHMNPPPSDPHQELRDEMLHWLKGHWEKPRPNRVRAEIALTPADNLENWTHDYRTPDLMLLRPDRFHIMHEPCYVGAPTAAVEIRSPGDETYEKRPFYASLGVPELWVIDRDSRRPELHVLRGGEYELQAPNDHGRLVSETTGIDLRHPHPHKLTIRLIDAPETERCVAQLACKL